MRWFCANEGSTASPSSPVSPDTQTWRLGNATVRRRPWSTIESRARSRSVTRSRLWPIGLTSHGWSRPPTTVETRSAGKPRSGGTGPAGCDGSESLHAVRLPATASGSEASTIRRMPQPRPSPGDGVGARSEGVLGSGEGAALDVRVVGLGRPEQLAVEVGVLLDEAGHPARAQTERVLPDQHLTVALDAGADPDGGDRELLGDLG